MCGFMFVILSPHWRYTKLMYFMYTYKKKNIESLIVLKIEIYLRLNLNQSKKKKKITHV